MQKGIDLIADIMLGVLRDNENVQLICVGPVIDLYGKFAALKLQTIAQKFPSRVYSKPEFTALPPFIFSGADFALIPSRDEPFGLVAVEFGRKGYVLFFVSFLIWISGQSQCFSTISTPYIQDKQHG